MSKKRNKKKYVPKNNIGKGKIKKLTPEQIIALGNIIKAAQPTFKENVKMKFYEYFHHRNVAYLAKISYGVKLNSEGKYFRKLCYKEYAFGKVFKDFSGLHTLMITKCNIFSNNWTKFIDENGKPKINK